MRIRSSSRTRGGSGERRLSAACVAIDSSDEVARGKGKKALPA
jgi:hypothetical protein